MRVTDRRRSSSPRTRSTSPAPFEAIDQPRDVRRAFEHPGRDLAAGIATGMHAAEDAQDVELRLGDALGRADRVDPLPDVPGGDEDVEHGFLSGMLERGLPDPLLENVTHDTLVTQRIPCFNMHCAARPGRAPVARAPRRSGQAPELDPVGPCVRDRPRPRRGASGDARACSRQRRSAGPHRAPGRGGHQLVDRHWPARHLVDDLLLPHQPVA